MSRSVARRFAWVLAAALLLVAPGAGAQEPPADPLVTDPAGDTSPGAPPEADILAVWFEHTVQLFHFNLHVAEPPPGGSPIRYRVQATPENAYPAPTEDCVSAQADVGVSGEKTGRVVFGCGDDNWAPAEIAVTELPDGSAVVTISVGRGGVLVDDNALMRPHATSSSAPPPGTDGPETLWDETADGRDYLIESAPGTCTFGETPPPDPEGDGVPVAASRDENGCYANAGVEEAVLSDDGRFLAFSTYATNLATPDVDGRPEIYVKDIESGGLQLVTSINDDTVPFDLSISADGRYVLYQAWRPDAPRAERFEIVREDLATGEVERIDVDIPENYGHTPVLSADGRHAAFVTVSGSNAQTFVRDIEADRTIRVSIPNNKIEKLYGGGQPSLSANGRYVAFVGDTLKGSDVKNVLLIRDVARGTTHLVKASRKGKTVRAPMISGDGRYVAYARTSSLSARDQDQLFDVYLYNVRTGRNRFVSQRPERGEVFNGIEEPPHDIAIDEDGSAVLYTSGSVIPQHDEVGLKSVEAYSFDRLTGAVRAISPKVRVENRYARTTDLTLSADGLRAAFLYRPADDPEPPRMTQAFYLDLTL